MKRKILSCFIVGIISINFNGCFQDEISCNEDTVKDLVEEIAKEDVLNAICAIKLNNKGTNLYSFNIDEELVNKFSNSLFQSYFKEIKNQISIDKFILGSFITINKNKEFKKVECKSSLKVFADTKEYNFDVEYEAQLTDDGKEVYVEVKSLYKK